jgi:cytochrome P450
MQVESPMRDRDRAIDIARTVPDAPSHELADYEDVSFVLRSRDFAPIRAESGNGAQWHTLIIRDAIIDLAGDEHFERRRLLSGLFKRAVLLQEYEQDYLVPALDELEVMLREAAVGSAPGLDLVPAVRKLMLRVIARLVGLDGLDGDEARYAAFERVMRLVEHGARSKFVANKEEVVTQALVAQAELVDDYFRPAWAARSATVRAVAEGSLPPGALKNDLITLMVQHEPHYRAFGEDAVYREASLLLIASVGSTTNAICFAIWDLAQWLKRHLQDQARRLDLDFLRRCFAESLRLGQTNPILRTADADVRLPSGLEIAAGDVISINRRKANAILAADGHSDIGDTEFDPHRQLSRNVAQYGLAFGGGGHMCIGRDFAIGPTRGVSDLESEYLGVGVRMFVRFEQWGVEPDPDYVPVWDKDLTQRPTWQTLPVTFSALQGPA